MVTNTTGTAKRTRESFLEVNATAQQARNGVQMAIKKTVNIQRVLENAPKRSALCRKRFPRNCLTSKGREIRQDKEQQSLGENTRSIRVFWKRSRRQINVASAKQLNLGSVLWSETYQHHQAVAKTATIHFSSTITEDSRDHAPANGNLTDTQFFKTHSTIAQRERRLPWP
jgi:hypothetical protein